MSRILHLLSRLCLILLVVSGLYLFWVTPAGADIAPPDQPPGANPLPDSLDTRVQMVAETVILTVKEKHPENLVGQAKVTASFTMRNLGVTEESLAVRFPLSFWDGSSDGFGEYPAITDLQVWVNKRSTPIRRFNEPNPANQDEVLLPWAVFTVVFPPETDVQIDVAYTTTGVGEYPFVAYRYILETGAGWQGPIGSAEIIVRLPHEANPQNVIFDEHTGFSETTPGGVFAGKEVRWQFNNLEPTRSDNFEVSLVMPEAWKKIIYEQGNVARDPADGDAWGRLGKLYKEIGRLRRGVRQDAGGQELYRSSLAAYERALELLPDDALWHYGFADLLWFHYYFHVYMERNNDSSELNRAVQELQLALGLDPDNPKVIELLDEISYSVPGVVEQAGGSYDFLILTATPVFWPSPTPSETPPATAPVPGSTATRTLTPPPQPLEPTPTLLATPVIQAELPADSAPLAVSSPTPAAPAGLPGCRAFLPLPVLVVIVILLKPYRLYKKGDSR